MLSSSAVERPSCPRCGEPIGAYEPIWHVGPQIGAEPTAWLRVRDLLGPRDSLWHAACAEADGVDGG